MECPVAGSPRRSTILDSALAEFAAHGYHGARIERIAASARANKQLIFHYFGSKDGLYEAAVARVFSAAPAPGDSAATPLEVIKGRIAAVAGWLEENPGAAPALTECASGRGLPQGAVQSAAAWVGGESGALRTAVEDGQRRGFFRDDLDSQLIVELVLGSLVGRATMSRSPRGNGEGVRRYAETLGQMIADYCAWR
jgi:AcrR family transcriptional regulator